MKSSQSRLPLLGKSVLPYGLCAAMVAAVTLFGLLTARFLQAPNVDVLYLLVVLVAALKWGRGPGFWTAIISSIVFDFCFIPPYFSFAVTDLAYVLNLVGFLVVAFAISELVSRAQHLMREQVRRAQDLGREQAARIEAEARSRAKDEIFDKIAHELRSPASVVMGWTQILKEASPDHDRLLKGLSALERNSKLLTRLVDDLLNASRIRSGKLAIHVEPMLLGPVVSSAVDAARMIADRKHVDLHVEVSEIGDVLGDEQRLMQLITNLLTNAIKFTPAGGQVSLTLTKAADYAELVIRDTGIGISADLLPRVFEPFVQASTPEQRQGLGLGLAIAKHVVAAHSGTMSVASAGEGLGTTFTVELPTIAAIAATAIETPTVAV